MSDLLRHLFWPHESNNHKPKILHRHSLLFLTGFLIVAQSGLSLFQVIAPRILGYASQIPPEAIVELTNQKRAEVGAGPLTLDPRLSDAARRKAADMFTKNYWAHNAPDGTKPWDFILAAGYNYLHAGENLARDFTNAPDVVNAWMNSPTHKENLLNPRYQNIGVAVVDGRLTGVETTLVVQMFGTPQSAAPAVTQNAASIVQPVLAAQSIPQLSPAPIPLTTPAPEVVVTSLPSQPRYSLFNASRALSLTFAILIVIVLCIDWFVAWRKNLIRLSGKNWAHLTYMIIIIILAILLRPGLIN